MFLNVKEANNIMVDILANLEPLMKTMRGRRRRGIIDAMLAEANATIHTKHVLFIFPKLKMITT